MDEVNREDKVNGKRTAYLISSCISYLALMSYITFSCSNQASFSQLSTSS